MLFVFMLPLSALAHTKDSGRIFVTIRGQELDVRMELGASALEDLAHLPDYSLDERTSPALAKQLVEVALMGGELRTSEGGLCSWSQPSAQIEQRRVILAAVVRCPAAAVKLVWKLPVVEGMKDGFQILGKADFNGTSVAFEADRSHSTITLAPTPNGFGDFILIGIEHIGAAPSEWLGADRRLKLPDGIDHILFILALVLGGGGVWGLLKTVTGFTLGHSATLACVALGWVQVPSRLVESAIALSIVVVAAEDLIHNLWGRVPRHRWRIAAVFGLVHGFGFATALASLHLEKGRLMVPLVGFNLGVEVGQAIIVLLIFPALCWLQKSQRFYLYVVRLSAALILAAGFIWFIQRVFLPQ